MVRTRFALKLYFRMVAHKVACHTCQRLFYIHLRNGTDSVMSEILFTQDSKVEYLFCGAPLDS